MGIKLVLIDDAVTNKKGEAAKKRVLTIEDFEFTFESETSRRLAQLKIFRAVARASGLPHDGSLSETTQALEVAVKEALGG